MSDTLVNLRDIRFVLYEMLDVETLTTYPYFAEHSRETFDTVLDAAYRLAREVSWPAYAEMDRVGATHDAKNQKTRVPECMHANLARLQGWRLAWRDGAGRVRRAAAPGHGGRGDGVDVQRRQYRGEHVHRRGRRRRRSDPFVRQRHAEEDLSREAVRRRVGRHHVPHRTAGRQLAERRQDHRRQSDGR